MCAWLMLEVMLNQAHVVIFGLIFIGDAIGVLSKHQTDSLYWPAGLMKEEAEKL